jgi:hypothetical protein
MVSLAVADTSSPNNLKKTISLRHNALWFPRIPEDYLQLNKSYVKSTNTAVSGFRPLCCLFRDATNPAELSKVSVTSEVQTSEIESFETLGFDCHYGTEDTRRLGPSIYSTSSTKTEGYIVKRTAKEVKDIITFVKNGELRRPEVSNYSKCLLSETLNTQIL